MVSNVDNLKPNLDVSYITQWKQYGVSEISPRQRADDAMVTTKTVARTMHHARNTG